MAAVRTQAQCLHVLQLLSPPRRQSLAQTKMFLLVMVVNLALLGTETPLLSRDLTLATRLITPGVPAAPANPQLSQALKRLLHLGAAPDLSRSPTLVPLLPPFVVLSSPELALRLVSGVALQLNLLLQILRAHCRAGASPLFLLPPPTPMLRQLVSGLLI